MGMASRASSDSRPGSDRAEDLRDLPYEVCFTDKMTQWLSLT